MADRFELSYIYARVCGAMNRSWAGSRSAELVRQTRLSDLWRILFDDASPSLPERSLLGATEERLVKRSLEEFHKLADELQRDEPFFLALRRKAEFARVKRILLAVKDAEPACPPSEDPSLPDGFLAGAYPRLEEMFAEGRYSWIDGESALELSAAENRLDRQYYEELWTAASLLPRPRRAGLPRMLGLEIELENVVWALRLARYYAMPAEMVKPLLVSIPDVDVTGAAMEALGFRMDKRQDWDGWKYEFLVDGPAEPWALDVRAVETGARRYLYKKARLALHMNPSSYAPLYCFFKLKELETAVVIGIAEGIHLGASAEELASFALAGGVQ